MSSHMNGKQLFHRHGLTWFWFLNDECRPETLRCMVDAFATANPAAVVLHPRPGLLLPYGGDDWFAFIRTAVKTLVDADIPVWLYDEDPYPSGAAGGRLAAAYPEFEARSLQSFTLRETPDDQLFCFPFGKLIWCGLVRETDGDTIDLTSRAGVVRRRWELRSPWDSRYYYPATPLYECARSDAYDPEFALRIDNIPAGYHLQAVVARPCGNDSVWGTLPDTLNPAATKIFLAWTHERYAETIGEFFGNGVEAVFTDEPKFFGDFPWTPGLFDDFALTFGYDLRPQLWRLFAASEDPQSMLVRIHYRDWCRRRFETSWMQPVAGWCRDHDLALVGHISPEDDPVQQVACVGNLPPLFRHFDIPGIDLIIPAVGDADHGLLNVGVLAAVSAAQQNGQPGVLSESLACSGHEATVDDAAKILKWQLLMGVSTPVVHGAFSSVTGHRIDDAPPDWGPHSRHWEGMRCLSKELEEFQEIIRNARQIAPVAVLWPIRSFAAQPFVGYSHEAPRRDRMVELLNRCLDRQVGIHLLDEEALWNADRDKGALRLGRASYSVVVLPPCRVLHEKTLNCLQQARDHGIAILLAEQSPAWVQASDRLRPFDADWLPPLNLESLLETLPRLWSVNVKETAGIRCSTWETDGHRTQLLMNLTDQTKLIRDRKDPLTLPPCELIQRPLPPA